MARTRPLSKPATHKNADKSSKQKTAKGKADKPAQEKWTKFGMYHVRQDATLRGVARVGMAATTLLPDNHHSVAYTIVAMTEDKCVLSTHDGELITPWGNVVLVDVHPDTSAAKAVTTIERAVYDKVLEVCGALDRIAELSETRHKAWLAAANLASDLASEVGSLVLFDGGAEGRGRKSVDSFIANRKAVSHEKD